MNRALVALTSKLSFGESHLSQKKDSSHSLVETLARAYEKARNALEYRADNLVRRAAVERILKRRIVINPEPISLAENLLTELRWARYLTIEESKSKKIDELTSIIQKYVDLLGGPVPQEWVIKVASAEIEEFFDLNTDYKQFTFFAFQMIRQKIKLEDENLELLIYFSVDKIYAASDDEQILYHILTLGGENISKEKLAEAWHLFNLAKKHKDISKIIKYVRRQMPPLILLRDMYFYAPSDFRSITLDEEKFMKMAADTLEIQLNQMSGKVATAGTRSVIYVFLTKMVLAFGLEVPFEIFFYGSISRLPLILNLLFPPILMWLITMQIKLPKISEREALLGRTWNILQNFDELGMEADILIEIDKEKSNSFGYGIFSVLYAIFFVGIFGIIYFVLNQIGFTFSSKIVFVFFLTVIAFFAYRIVQVAKVYSWKGIEQERSGLTDIISLPILSIGSRLSKGLSKLNFLAFAFDFILEAPFKIILGFVDDWVQFLSVKKEEEILE